MILTCISRTTADKDHISGVLVWSLYTG